MRTLWRKINSFAMLQSGNLLKGAKYVCADVLSADVNLHHWTIAKRLHSADLFGGRPTCRYALETVRLGTQTTWSKSQGVCRAVCRTAAGPLSLLGGSERWVSNSCCVNCRSYPIVLHHPTLCNPPPLEYKLHHLRDMVCSQLWNRSLINCVTFLAG